MSKIEVIRKKMMATTRRLGCVLSKEQIETYVEALATHELLAVIELLSSYALPCPEGFPSVAGLVRRLDASYSTFGTVQNRLNNIPQDFSDCDLMGDALHFPVITR